MSESKIPEFYISMLKEQYGDQITEQILAGYNISRAVTLRANTLKTSISEVETKLSEKGIKYKKVSYSPEAFIILNATEKELQTLDMYENGEIYLQSLSSMLPPIILNPLQNTDILDMAAAPGGKTTQIAALTENKAHITACELNKIRAERLKYNIEKQGATCAYVMVTDARRIDSFFSFDQILLDAPCSGSGTLNEHDQNLEKTFTTTLINKTTAAQIALLRKAISILKPGKEMVYSTCSILQCENEDIVTKALKGTNAEIVPIEFEKMDELPLLPSKIPGTLCVCPNELYEGFYIAKIRKNK